MFLETTTVLINHRKSNKTVTLFYDWKCQRKIDFLSSRPQTHETTRNVYLPIMQACRFPKGFVESYNTETSCPSRFLTVSKNEMYAF